jgi:hypothetical protein
VSQSVVLSAVPKGFTPFEADEVAQLELYHELVSDLESHKLALPQDMTFEVDADGSLKSGPDRENLEALSTAFRKIGLLEKDDGTFARVRNLLSRHAHDAGTAEAMTLLATLKNLKRLRAEAFRASALMGYQLEHPDGSVEEMTPDDVINMLVNGAIFHSDAALRARWKQLDGWRNPAIWMMATTTIQELVIVFKLLDQIVDEVLTTPGLRAS